MTMTFPDLAVSELPIALRGARRPTTGRFNGSISLEEGCWNVKGVLERAALSEWVAGVAGHVERLDIDAELDADTGLTALHMSGRIDDIELTRLWWAVKQPAAGGCGRLTIDRMVWRGGQLEALQARGTARDIDVSVLASAWGLPEVIGQLSITVDAWHADRAGVRTADFTVRLDPPAADRALIDRGWIVMLARWIPHLEVEHLPMGLLEFERLSVRLVWDGQRLLVHGGAADGHTALTLRLLGRAVPVIRLPQAGADITPAWSDIAPIVTKIIHMDVVGDGERGYAHMTY